MYYRLNVQGTLGSGEKWSVNPCFLTDATAPPDHALLQAAATAAADVDVPGNLAAAKSIQAPVTGVRLEVRSASHDLLDAAEAAFTGSQTGGSAPQMPPQTSVVLSLRTQAVGASGRGRLYWPGLGLTIASPSLRIPSGNRDPIAADAVTWLGDLQTALQDGVNGATGFQVLALAVISRSTSAVNAVNRIMVGDVFDTQRKRRDALAESYKTVTYP